MKWTQTSISRTIFWFSIATGVVLCAIGLRFLIQPETAAGFFGIDRRTPGIAPHAAIALRDLWLGLILIAFTVLKDWRAIAIWLGLGALVCLGDAAIALVSSGRWVSVSFHVASGMFCTWLASAAWRLHDRSKRTSDRG